MKVQININENHTYFMNENNNTSPLEPVTRLIPMGKSGIHIKKSHEGRFTEYCGGKVTDAKIQAAKRSSDPKIRKQAVFAENARKWKHQEGGILRMFQEGGSINEELNQDVNINDLFVDYTGTAPKGVADVSNFVLTNPMPTFGSDSYATFTPKTKVAEQQYFTTPYQNKQVITNISLPWQTSGSTSVSETGSVTTPRVVRAGNELTTAINPWLGYTFQLGGNGSGHTLDCSHFTSRVMSSLGYNVKGTADDQYRNTDRIDFSQLQPGDLVFLHNTQPGKRTSSQASHVAIVTDTSDLASGKIRVAEASSKRGSTVTDKEWDINNDSFYKKHYFAAGRPRKNNA